MKEFLAELSLTTDTYDYIFSRVTRITRLPSSLVDLSEPMEVVRFEQGGFSHAHHDSSPANPNSSCAHTHLAANNSASNQVECR